MCAALFPFAIQCNAESVDITKYILPEVYNGSAMLFYVHPRNVNKEYKSIDVVTYNHDTVDKAVLMVHQDPSNNTKMERKLMADYEYKYSVGDNSIDIVTHSPNSGKKREYVIPRFIELDKTYNDGSVGTILISPPNHDSKDVTYDMFSLTEMNKKDCLVHSKEIKSKRIDMKEQYFYCRPYGLSFVKVYEKDGTSEILTQLVNIKPLKGGE